jgi:hypothetical protein
MPSQGCSGLMSSLQLSHSAELRNRRAWDPPLAVRLAQVQGDLLLESAGSVFQCLPCPHLYPDLAQHLGLTALPFLLSWQELTCNHEVPPPTAFYGLNILSVPPQES